ncbi:hypothetical protein MKW98_004493, partial [Papaver atlanticum]
RIFGWGISAIYLRSSWLHPINLCTTLLTDSLLRRVMKNSYWRRLYHQDGIWLLLIYNFTPAPVYCPFLSHFMCVDPSKEIVGWENTVIHLRSLPPQISFA